MLGLDKKDFNNASKVYQFIGNIAKEFHHILITEHLDESLIVMRRKFCWDISEVFYFSCRVKDYSYKNTTLRSDLLEKLTNWSNVDVLLYKTFNRTLWGNIATQGVDFWSELNFYKSHMERVALFCSEHLDKTIRRTLLSRLGYYIIIPDSPWGKGFKVDTVWCLVSRLGDGIFKNIFRVLNYPELCKATIPNVDITEFKIFKSNSTVKLNPNFCSNNKTSLNHTFQLPVSILLRQNS